MRTPQTRLLGSAALRLMLARVRRKLNLKPGDTVIFEESEDGAVLLRRAEPLDIEFLSALEKTLSEWNSENDDEAYDDL
jgi:antitoxin PrlF